MTLAAPLTSAPLDLSLLDSPPDLSVRAVMTIAALAPLSMVARLPGKYYRSQPAPTNDMLYGLLENALGWHIAERDRGELVKRLAKRHKTVASRPGGGYVSVLQHHVRFGTPQLPAVMHYQDYWSQHLKGNNFVTGSRDYDRTMIPVKIALAEGRIKVDDLAASIKDPAILHSFRDGDALHMSVMRDAFPQYYVSPTPREYVVPDGVYRYAVDTGPQLATLLARAFTDPAAPLYLGSSDGWVDVEWRVMA